MSGPENIRSLLIIGSGVSAWLPAAMLAARLPRTAWRINVCDLGDTRADTLLARPYICRAHDLIGIDDAILSREASARPVHAFAIEAVRGNEAVLPFGDYGLPFQGAAFNQYWLRAHRAGKARPLADYNLALRLAKAGSFLSKAPNGFPFLDYGYQLPRQAYGALLRHVASRAGVNTLSKSVERVELSEAGLIDKVTLGGKALSPDLTVCAGSAVLPEADLLLRISQSHNGIHIKAASKLAGLELHQLQTGTMRLMSLWPGDSFTRSEKAEFDRLYRAETDRIEDMSMLLCDEIGNAAGRSALQRKRQVFAARGRIPTEDYEVFSKSEWLAALSSCDIIPRQYDRLVDRMSLEQTIFMVTQIGNRVDQLVDKHTTTRRTT